MRTSLRPGSPGPGGLWAVLFLVGALFGLANAATSDEKLTQMQIFMRAKLSYAQATLEGITLEKFDVASKNAIRLREMTQTNLWFKIQYPKYVEETKKFQANIDKLILAATDKNVNAAIAAYAKVSQNCVECHQMLRRDQRRVP